ncbi:MAG TPA: carboxylating nicotinate-nucleotide diphosphorylase [Magnetospirillaceae bacterium]|nr:carboxylating nicotinate-nucleotide diphosphorylase [Magnetospirillaceae bacterium]
MDATVFETLLDLALREDLGGRGDVTSLAIFSESDVCSARLVCKDSGVLCGVECFSGVFGKVDSSASVRLLVSDGELLSPGSEVALVAGRTRSILQAERTAINFLSFLSGIATAASSYARAAREKGRALVLDTRKTLPGYRALSKYAVRVGGGKNHRHGLHDMILIKDNHIDAAGGIPEAIRRVRSVWGREFQVEVECRNVEEVRQAIEAGAEIVMLDNMDYGVARDAIALRKDGVLFEASGGVSLETAGDWSALGVDYISVGRMTHSVRSLDFSLTMVQGGDRWIRGRQNSTS